MQIRCPHCQNAIELIDDADFQSIDCPSCGSQFGLVDVEQQEIDTLRKGRSTTATIGHFELIEEVGRGAFGTVWRARDAELDRQVAVKIPRQYRLSVEDREQFLREARAVAQLNHPSIVSVHEVGRDGERLYIVSDFVEGATLAEKLSAQRLSQREAVELCVKIAAALEHAHESGVIHRDLKPSNIMLTADGEPHVMDFGLAKREAGEITMTVEGKVLGTPAYMPPEQARGEGHHVDRRGDIYSLGVILYELLSGELPFRGATRMLLQQVIHDEAPSPRKLNNAIPRDLETITLKCLQKEPSRRYQGAAELAADLERWLCSRPIKARPTTWMGRSWRWCKRKPTVAGLSGVVVLLLLTLGIVGVIVGLQQTANSWKEIGLRNEAETARQHSEDQAQRADEAARNATASADQARRNLKVAERNAYNSDMLLAQRDWEDTNIIHLRELLDRHRQREDLKGFEWGYWNRLVNSDLLTLRGHSSNVTSVSFSPNGERIVSGSDDNTVKVWNAETGEEIFTLEGHSNWINSVGFSPDGKRIVSGSQDNTLKIWDAETGQLGLTLNGHANAVSSVCFSPDGSRIVSGSEDDTLKVWDVESGEEIFALLGHTDSVTSVCFSPDGSRIVSGSADDTLKVWDVETGQQIFTLRGHSDVVFGVAFSPQGKQIVSCSQDNTIKVWDTETGQQMFTIKGHLDLVLSVNFSPDGERIVSGSEDRTVKIWNAETGQQPLSLQGHSGWVNSVSFSPDGTRIASGSDDKTVIVWDTDTGQPVLTLKGHTNAVISVSFSPDGTRIVSGSQDSTVKVWDAESGEEISSLQGHSGFVFSVKFSSDGMRIVSGGGSNGVGEIKVWDAETAQQLFALQGHTDVVFDVAFSPDGTRIASGGWDTTPKVWDARPLEK